MPLFYLRYQSLGFKRFIWKMSCNVIMLDFDFGKGSFFSKRNALDLVIDDISLKL